MAFSFSKILSSVFSGVSKWVGEFMSDVQEAKGTLTGKKPEPAKVSPAKKFQPPDVFSKPRWVHVVSSYLRSVRYDWSSRKLSVNYLGKKTCTYSNIPSATYLALLDYKGSKGQWARTHLFPLPYE